MQILANAQHAAIAVHVALKCPVNAGFRERMLKQMTHGDPHVQGKLLAVGWRMMACARIIEGVGFRSAGSPAGCREGVSPSQE